MKRSLFLVPFMALLTLVGCKKGPETSTDVEAPKWEAAADAYFGDIGETITVTATVIAKAGLDRIEVTIPAWNLDGKADTDEILATGSPKSFPVSYEVKIPETAAIGEKTFVFTMYDAKGQTSAQNVTVTVKDDNTAPMLQITSPEEDAVLSPNQQLSFVMVATDNLKMRDVVISCDDIEFEETFTPTAANPATVSVNYNLPLTDMSGEYTFKIVATDASGNEATESRKISVLFDSKPRIVNNLPHDILGVVGGTAIVDFLIESHQLHPLTEVTISIPALEMSQSMPLEAEQWQVELKMEIPVPAEISDDMTRNIAYSITAKNDVESETTVHNGTINLFKQIFMVGRGTMAREKASYAIPLTQSTENPNVFEGLTWIDVVGDGIKLMDSRVAGDVTPDFIWGLDSDGKVISNNTDLNAEGCNYFVTANKGYHKITFNPATWEYTLEQHTAPAVGKHELVHLNGARWLWWDETNNIWIDWGDNWGGVMPMKHHPDTPHRFYVDIRTYSTDEIACLFRFFGQADYSTPGGIYYGVTDVEIGAWVDIWWEWAGPLYERDTYEKCSYLCGKGRMNALTRITFDSYLGQFSWISLEEELSWGWEVYPPKYTGDWK
jgi:hypothetical protein